MKVGTITDLKAEKECSLMALVAGMTSITLPFPDHTD